MGDMKVVKGEEILRRDVQEDRELEGRHWAGSFGVSVKAAGKWLSTQHKACTVGQIKTTWHIIHASLPRRQTSCYAPPIQSG
jgi:hypothetical protein